MFCPACGFNIAKDFRFCPSCGTQLPGITAKTENKIADKSDKSINNESFVVCEVCGEENPQSSELCSSCGALLSKDNVVAKPVAQKKFTEKKLDKTEKQKEPNKKAGKQIHEVSGRNSISPLNIMLLIAGLLLIGYLILDFAGIFDKPEHTHVNTPGTTNTPGINLAEVESINQLEKQVLADTTQSQLVLELAHKLGDSGFYDRAVRYYELYLRHNPNNADVHVDLGVVLFEQKQYEKAKSRMMKGLALNPTHQIAHFNIGVVNSAQSNLDSAKIWWKKAIDINPASEIGRRAQELLNSH